MTLDVPISSAFSITCKSIPAQEPLPMPGHTERDFHTAIKAGLTSSGGYVSRSPSTCADSAAPSPVRPKGEMCRTAERRAC